MKIKTAIQQIQDVIQGCAHRQSLEWLADRMNAGAKLFRLNTGCAGEDDIIAVSSMDEARDLVGYYAAERDLVSYRDGFWFRDGQDWRVEAYETPFEATGWSLTAIEIAD